MFDEHANWKAWSQRKNYQSNGFIAGFLYNLTGDSIDKPEYYTENYLKEIISEYTIKAEEENRSHKDTEEKNPNVLFIMNESFSDPDNLEKIKLSRNPIPFFKEISEEGLNSNLLTPGYGGGTANTEFESLTAISLEVLKDNVTTPYIQMTKKMEGIPNIVKKFNKKDYNTVAIHPYNTTMYKRPDVYSAFGFDEFIYDETMQTTHKYEENNYISDQASYDELLYQLKKTSKSSFIHLVTMHGHKGYNRKYDYLEYELEEESYDNELEIRQYYQGLSYSDDDFKDLIEQVNKLEEDTLLVFWGDHLPGIFSEDTFIKEEQVDRYETPVLFYTNYENELSENKVEIMSPIYFMNNLSEMLNLKASPYTMLMKELEMVIPAFKRGIYIEGNNEKIKSEREELSENSKKC